MAKSNKIEEIQNIRTYVGLSFKNFCNLILDEDLPKHCYEWVDFFENNKHCCLLGPREHAKTVTLRRYMLWKILQNRDIRIVLISETSSLSTNILRYPREQIESNPQIKRYWGNLINDTCWREKEIVVKRPDKQEINSTVYALGMWGSVVGRRADLLLFDDPIDFRKISTEDIRSKVIDWIFREVWQIMPPSGKMIMVGSRKGPDDLYSYIMTEKSKLDEFTGKPIIATKVYKAIINEDTKEVLWPEYWTYERLMQRKAEGEVYDFMLNYQNEVVGQEHTLIGDIKLVSEACKADIEEEYQHDGESMYAMGVDFSIEDDPIAAANKDTDYFSITIMKRMGLEQDPNAFVHKICYCYRTRGITPDEQEEKVIELCKRFKPVLIYCESTGFQRMFSWRLQKNTRYPIKEFKMTKRKWSPVDGLPTLRQRFATRKYVIPGTSTNEAIRRLIHELKIYSPDMGREHDDMVMSFYLCDRALIDAPNFYQRIRVVSI